MSRQKYLEIIERKINDWKITCLVETQGKYNRLIEEENIEKINSRREMKDKKVEV